MNLMATFYLEETVVLFTQKKPKKSNENAVEACVCLEILCVSNHFTNNRAFVMNLLKCCPCVPVVCASQKSLMYVACVDHDSCMI